jgi:hypothetical protein
MTIEEQLEVESSIELARINYKDHRYSFLAISRGSSRGLARLYRPARWISIVTAGIWPDWWRN